MFNVITTKSKGGDYMFKRFLNSEVLVYCVVPYSTFFADFTGVLSSEDDDSITLTSAKGSLPLSKKYKSIIIKKDTIISIGQV